MDIDWNTIIVAAIAAIPPTLVSIAVFMKSKNNAEKIDELHVVVNSRLSELLEKTATANMAEGELKGRQDLKVEQALIPTPAKIEIKIEAEKIKEVK